MSSTADLVTALKAELKAARMSYAQLAPRIGLAESSVKRMFARGDMTLSRIDDVLRVLRLDFADIARRVADAQPQRRELSAQQEEAIVADRRLLLLAICCLSQWTFEQIVEAYTFSPTEVVRAFVALDRLGIIELKAGNRYRLHLAKTFRWRPQGPVMTFFREHAADDYFSGGFDGAGETLVVVHGEIGRSLSGHFADRLQRVAHDFSQQHLIDQKLPADQKQPYTLVIGMRSWLFAAFRDLQRHPAAPDQR